MDSAPTGAGMSRRRAAMALDLATGPLSFFGWIAGGTALTLHSTDNMRNIILGALPGALWLALLLACAWRGQTPAQALLRLRWVDPVGARARWRPLGDVGFWCAGLFVLVIPVAAVTFTIIGLFHWTTSIATLWLPSCGAVALIAAVLARHTRRNMVTLVRVSRQT